ncbi:MAG: NAD(P)-dependent oxidoreductase [Cyanobacteria bacterium P01_F01_bin.42]
MTRVALLGTGVMGSRLAQNLIQAKYDLVLYNRTESKLQPLIQQGATYAATPKAAAEQADVIISMVTNDEASHHIWLHPETGAAQGLGENKVAIESSTLTVAWTQQLARQISARGALFLDAPVVGSRPQAEAKGLIALVGGTAETLAIAESTLLAAGIKTIHHVGTTGQGMAMKLAVNGLFGIQVVALAEAISMLAKSEIPREQSMTILENLPILSPAAKLAGRLMLSGNHAPLFPIDLVEKDLRYLLETDNADMPISQSAHSVYREAIAMGYGNQNITGIIQRFA